MANDSILLPPRLRPGLTIGICSPSAPVTRDMEGQFNAGARILEWFSVHTTIAPHTWSNKSGLAPSIQERLDDFHGLWRDPDVKMIIFSQGGDNAHELLSGLDYELFRRDPKILVGISDATTILNAVYARSGIVTYHGTDVVWGLGRRVSNPIRDNFIDTFFAGVSVPLKPFEKARHVEDSSLSTAGWRVLAPGRATGRLVGGNITCFKRLLDLGYAPSTQDTILFLEDVLSDSKTIEQVESMLRSINERGVFDQIRGLVIGWLEAPRELVTEVGERFRRFVADLMGPRAVPVLQIGELGHNVENFIFPIGCEATIDTQALTISLEGSPSGETQW